MKTRIIPVVIRALGANLKKFNDFVKLLELRNLNTYVLQQSALLGTVSILCQILSILGAGCSQSQVFFIIIQPSTKNNKITVKK